MKGPLGRLVCILAKVSHFEVLCRVHDIQPTVGLFRCFYVNSKNKGWMSFSKRFDSSDMDLLAFIRTADPTKVKIGERQHAKDEPKLLDSTVRRVVPLLTIAPDRSEGELEASVDKLFDEGGSTEQGDSTNILHHLEESLIVDLAVTGGKSSSVIRQLLESSILNVEAGVSAVATLPFLTSSVSATLKRKTGGAADSGTKSQLRTVNPSARFVISSDSSHRSSTNASEVEVDSCIRSIVPPPKMTEAVAVTSATSAPVMLVLDSAAKVIPSV
ncbi:hypothetical protein Tco_0480794 [Tanacetum coccineum]